MKIKTLEAINYLINDFIRSFVGHPEFKYKDYGNIFYG